MKHDLETLVQAYVDGVITAGDMARLNALLAEDSEARRDFAELLNLDSSLAALAVGWRLEPREEVRVARFPSLARWIAVAAGVTLLAGGGWWWQSSRTVFATVEKSLGVAKLEAGNALRGGIFAFEEGTIELLTARGARVVIEAPAEFRFETAQRLRMTRGRLAADVPPSAKGFTVITPTGEAVDLGTRFGVDIPATGVSEVHVFEGEVVATANGASREQNLYAGDALTMEGGTGTARNLRSAAFIQSDELHELNAHATDVRRARSDAALAGLRDDPALIALVDFEAGEEFPGVFRTVQGRWPGSWAKEFVNDGDHLKLEIGSERTWPQLTLAAWVRLDQLGALYQSLLHVDGWDDGNFGRVHWMITDATTMRFAMWGNTLAPDSRETQDYPDSRTPVLSDKGRWVHLVTVYDADAGTVRFYLNGRFDKEVRQDVRYPARLGAAQIGNWNEGERKLSGRVDDLVVLGRVMDETEIRLLHEIGNPYQ